MRHLMAVLAALLVAIPTSALTCTKDTDCKGDRICVSGACSAPDVQPAESPSSHATPIEQAADRGGARSFHFNLLGLLQFGLNPTLEFGGQTTLLLSTRLMNTGLLSYLVTAQSGEDFVWGVGVSAQIRRYLGAVPQSGTEIPSEQAWSGCSQRLRARPSTGRPTPSPN